MTEPCFGLPSLTYPEEIEEVHWTTEEPDPRTLLAPGVAADDGSRQRRGALYPFANTLHATVAMRSDWPMSATDRWSS